jgi:hypothetical protein
MLGMKQVPHDIRLNGACARSNYPARGLELALSLLRYIDSLRDDESL